MRLKPKHHFLPAWLPIVFACFTPLASHATLLPTTLLVGNTIVRPESIETVIRGIVARIVNGDIDGSALTFRGKGTQQTIPINAPSGSLKEILTILGISDNVTLGIAPIKTQFTLPESTLKIEVKNIATNSFEVRARWQVQNLKVSTQKIGIHVPKGLFDQPFQIESSPIEIGLKRNSAPIQFETKIVLDLTQQGTKIHLINFTTNLEGRNQPDFFVHLGQLRVNNQPLVLEWISNGNILRAEEPTIRAQFQQIEPNIVATMRARIADAIKENIQIAAKKIEAEPPFKYTFNTDQLLQNAAIPPAVKKLISGIEGEFLFSYLQYVKETNQFSAQIAAHLCFDSQCLINLTPPSPIGTRDIQAMGTNDDVGVVLYESVVQNIAHSPQFQKRIQEFYQSNGATPGVALSKKGVHVAFDPQRNSIAAVLNLEIDIKKTIKAGSSFGESLKLAAGDLIEYYFGTGEIVKIPIEVNFSLVGIFPNNQGQPNLLINTSIPFNSKGEFLSPKTCSYKDCPSNLSKMTDMVRGGFLSSLKQQFASLVPGSITLPIEKTLKVQDFQFDPKYIRITPNRGLLISAELTDQGRR